MLDHADTGPNDRRWTSATRADELLGYRGLVAVSHQKTDCKKEEMSDAKTDGSWRV